MAGNPSPWNESYYTSKNKRVPRKQEAINILLQLSLEERKSTAALLLGLDMQALKRVIRKADAVEVAAKKLLQERNKVVHQRRKAEGLTKELEYTKSLVVDLENKLKQAETPTQSTGTAGNDRHRKEINKWLDL